MAYFNNQQLFEKGSYKKLISNLRLSSGEQKDIAAVCWLDRTRRHFVSTVGSTSRTVLQERVRWRQFTDGACRMVVQVEMPQLAFQYYGACDSIDRHNRIRQDSIDLEKSVETKDWSFRMNCSLIGVIISDAFVLYEGGRGGRPVMKKHQFWCALATELIRNRFDDTGLRCRDGWEPMVPKMVPRSGTAAHLTPTKKRRRDRDGNFRSGRLQKKCKLCAKKSKWVCSSCLDDADRESFICHSQTERDCFKKHLNKCH